jgi:hypothetical protein
MSEHKDLISLIQLSTSDLVHMGRSEAIDKQNMWMQACILEQAAKRLKKLLAMTATSLTITLGCSAPSYEPIEQFFTPDCEDSYYGMTLYEADGQCTWSCDDTASVEGVAVEGWKVCERSNGQCNEQRDCIR